MAFICLGSFLWRKVYGLTIVRPLAVQWRQSFAIIWSQNYSMSANAEQSNYLTVLNSSDTPQKCFAMIVQQANLQVRVGCINLTIDELMSLGNCGSLKYVTPLSKNIVLLWSCHLKTICHTFVAMLCWPGEVTWLWNDGLVVREEHDETNSPSSGLCYVLPWTWQCVCLSVCLWHGQLLLQVCKSWSDFVINGGHTRVAVYDTFMGLKLKC